MPEHRHAADRRRWWRSEWPFLVLLALGAAYRALVVYAFPPAFVFGDGPAYLEAADELEPHPDRPVAYSLLLRLLSEVDRGVDLVAVVQHLLGLATAVLVYGTLRRLGVGPVAGALATVPVLVDEMQLSLEHSVLTDVLFMLVVLGVVALLAGSREPTTRTVAAVGALVGAALLIRVVGGPLLLVVAVLVVAAATSWRRRVVHVVVLVAAFAVPVAAYAGWYFAERGAVGVVGSSGKPLYMRTTTFVDCDRVHVPERQRVLCPVHPLGERRDPSWYGWHDPRTHTLVPEPGSSHDAAMREFARRAIAEQPLDYAAVVVRDTAMPFWSLARTDHYEYDTAYKWHLRPWISYEPVPDWDVPAYREHGGELLHPRQPWANALGDLAYVVAVPGPLMLALLLLAVAGFVVRRPGADTRPVRRTLALCLALAFVLIVVPNATAEFTWRYQLPLLTLLPMAAALGWARLRRPRHS